MPSSSQGKRALLKSPTGLLQQLTIRPAPQHARLISQSSLNLEEAETSTANPTWMKNLPPEFDLSYAYDKKQTKYLYKQEKRSPIGSRRLRQARATNQGISFDQLPYQCFQEARKVLAEQRKETVAKIELMKARIARLEAKPAETNEEKVSKGTSLFLKRKMLDQLKIEADIHDPQVKRRFENGLGDMNKPIYRYLADKKWREHQRLIVMQRVTQMNVIPDVFPQVDPVASVNISFSGHKVQPGEFVQSLRSQYPPNLNVQVFDGGLRFVTVVVIDPDVPDFENDKFDARCHGIYTNIEITPTNGKIFLEQQYQKAEHTILPWLPPYAFKGSPYHRLSVIMLQHSNNEKLNVEEVKSWVEREHFCLKEFRRKTATRIVGITMFRTQWDDGMLDLMKKYNIEGSDIQMKRKAPEKLPYQKRDTRRMRG